MGQPGRHCRRVGKRQRSQKQKNDNPSRGLLATGDDRAKGFQEEEELAESDLVEGEGQGGTGDLSDWKGS